MVDCTFIRWSLEFLFISYIHHIIVSNITLLEVWRWDDRLKAVSTTCKTAAFALVFFNREKGTFFGGSRSSNAHDAIQKASLR